MVRLCGERNIQVGVLDLNPPQSYLPPTVVFYQIDVTSTQEIQEGAAKIRQEVGEPTVLLNNAGTAVERLILDETEEQLRRIFDLDLLAHFHMVKEILPYVIKQNHGEHGKLCHLGHQRERLGHQSSRSCFPRKLVSEAENEIPC